MAEIKKINGNVLCDDVARDAADTAKATADAAMEKAGVQTDWEECDPASPAYFKNRPFGLVPYNCSEQKVTGPGPFEYKGNEAELVGDESNPTIDRNSTPYEVTAVFDGTEYNLEFHTSGESTASCWGNPTVGYHAYVTWDGNEPTFRISDDLQHIYLNDMEEHTIQVTARVAMRLDKFWLDTEKIEDDLAKAAQAANTQSDWDEESTVAVKYIKNRPFYKTKFILPKNEFDIDDWESVGYGHYRAKTTSCMNAIKKGYGYDIDYVRFSYVDYVTIGSIGTAIVYSSPTEISLFQDDFKITANYVITWNGSATPGDIVYADGYLYARNSAALLSSVTIHSQNDETIVKKIDPVYLPYTAGSGIAISDKGVISATGEWAGKKWAAVGDSLTAVNASQSAKYYHQYIADKTGITVENMGYGGSGYKKKDDESKAFYQRITSVPAGTNVVTIFGGGNDISYITDGGEWEAVTPTWTAGKYLRADSSGEVADYSGNDAWVVSDLIAVNPGDTLKFTAGIKFAKSVLVFYTSDQSHISHIASAVQEEYTFTDEVVTVPATAAYMRVGNVNTITTFSMMRKAANGLGNPTDTGTDTLCGCINKTIDNLYATLPTVQLGLITPTPWSGYNPADTGNKMEIYANAIVEICKLRGIPCLDLYHCSALRPWDEDFRNAAYSKSGDGVHPDETGHAIIAPRIKAFMDSLIL